MPREAYYGAYVYDIGDDRVDDATEMLREWKNAKRKGKDRVDSTLDVTKATKHG